MRVSARRLLFRRDPLHCAEDVAVKVLTGNKVAKASPFTGHPADRRKISGGAPRGRHVLTGETGRLVRQVAPSEVAAPVSLGRNGTRAAGPRVLAKEGRPPERGAVGGIYRGTSRWEKSTDQESNRSWEAGLEPMDAGRRRSGLQKRLVGAGGVNAPSWREPYDLPVARGPAVHSSFGTRRKESRYWMH
ncbi:hypothetical protein AXG93_1406s1130 [Marchantia polymorpha subsp. ruderalis]|uniref:Uncharacterized protein n=1 Tax=Marchantia polymorpha subsp. ruderalis TaxID=1480154 RepID=A0A176W1U3_MARPO|nr:hypothetical protein AXG93_1406s1130 [Marchantia polymorpha subsp. ruderalis]